MNKVSLIILNWNGLSDTSEFLTDLKKINKEDLEVKTIIVDNASDKEEVKALHKLVDGQENVEIIENKKNLGFAGGNNVGIKKALEERSEYIVVMNNDILVDKNFLAELVKVVKNDPKVGAVSPKMYFAKGFEFHKEKYKSNDLGKVIWYAGGAIDWDNVYGSTRGVDEVDIGQYSALRSTDFVTGACVLLTADAIRKVGMFDEKYYLYYEDTDLSLRLKKAGYKIVYAPDSVLWHKVSQSSGIGSDLNDYFTTRNRMLFGFKYARWRTKFALMRESMRLLFIGRTWQRKGIADFYLLNFGKGSWK